MFARNSQEVIPLEFYRHNWYYTDGILFVLMILFMGLWGTRYFSEIQVIIIYSFTSMLFHQFEEYGWPGGFPAFGFISLASHPILYSS